MKKLLIVLLSLGLVLAFSMTASALDVKFSGQYYLMGAYRANSEAAKEDDATSRAFFYTRTRVQTVFKIAEGLDFTTRFDAKKGFIMLPDQEGHILNPVVKNGKVTKVGIDATAPYPRTAAFERTQFKDVDLANYKIQE